MLFTGIPFPLGARYYPGLAGQLLTCGSKPSKLTGILDLIIIFDDDLFKDIGCGLLQRTQNTAQRFRFIPPEIGLWLGSILPCLFWFLWDLDSFVRCPSFQEVIKRVPR